MAHKYAEIAFTDSVREVQRQLGSRAGYAAFDEGDDHNHLMSEREQSRLMCPCVSRASGDRLVVDL
ncbi:MAG: hypothetical protein GY785_06245 [Gammaproteobacteria bacterium]|nr:hypothetical protein [Gammaproteobacteria bacterium]